MRKFMAIALGLLLLATAAVEAQCRNGSCSATAGFYPYQPQFATAPASQAKAGKLEWRRLDADEYALYRDGRHVAGYRPSKDEFLPVLADGDYAKSWPPCSPPAGVAKAIKLSGKCDCGPGCKCGLDPCPCVPSAIDFHAQAQADVPNYGIDLRELAKETANGPQYQTKHGEVSRAQAFAAMEARLTDDSSRKGAIVCVGDKSQCELLAKDWRSAPALATARQQFAFQAYDTADKLDSVMPRVRGYTDGLYVVGKDGHDLTGKGTLAYAGPEQLAKDVDGILNPKSPLIQPKIEVPIPSWVYLAGAGLLGWLLGKREQPK